MIGLYVHIPFCRTRCPYCDFVSNAIPGNLPRIFIDALCEEIAAFEGPGEASTVFFGGGTPSLLDPASLEQILAALRKRFVLVDPEITIEANPDDVSDLLMQAWNDLGINRASLGVQSFDDRVLRYLGRRHDAATARRACEAVSAWFANWGMDLIFGAPPAEAWHATLAAAKEYGPTHISTYGLTYESGTQFGTRADEAVDDESWLALYRQAHASLDGYRHYEISNFAHPGYECRHNLIYWHNEAYAGFGPGAYSFLDGVRSLNHAQLETYLRRPGQKAEALNLSQREIAIETVIQHLRLHEGIRTRDYASRFGRSIHTDFGPELASLCDRGLIEVVDEVIRPTRAGFELNNEIGMRLVD